MLPRVSVPAASYAQPTVSRPDDSVSGRAPFALHGMNNLPIALMSGAAIRHAHETNIVAHAILIGVDLGPNRSVTDSLATILWLIALRREKVEITVWEFFKIGAIAMPVALIAGLLFLWN
jgi:arsenical pump membrane protein